MEQDLDAFNQSRQRSVVESELKGAESTTRGAEHALKLVRQLKAQLEPGERARDRFTVGDILALSRCVAQCDGRSPAETDALQRRVLRAMLTLN